MRFGSKGSDKNDDWQALSQLPEAIAKLEKAAARYSVEITDEETELDAALKDEALMVDDTETEFKDAFEKVGSLRDAVKDRTLRDLLKRFLDIIQEKQRAWIWQQNYAEATVRDVDSIWASIEEADKEMVLLRQDLETRIGQLKSS